MATFASTTTVAPEQSRMEIERLLFKFGCSEFGVERMMPAINRAQESGQLLLTMEAE